MKNLIRVLLKLIILIFVACLIFFFWASSPTMNEKEYVKLIENDYPTTISNDSIYSIITYNVGYLSGMTNNLPVAKPKELFDENQKKVERELKKANADIVAFQEIDYRASRSYEVNQEDEFAKLGYNYVAKAVNWDERYVPFPYWPPTMHFGKIVSGQSIISKYKLKNHERIVLERVPDNPFYKDALYLERLAQVVKVVLDGKEIVVINTHLEAFDKITRVKQLNHVIEIFKKYSETHPTILLGDFNSDPKYKDPAINKMFDLSGVGNAAFSKDNYDLTFDTKDPFERLDYIFYTENTIEYVSGKVLKNFEQASDHLPVEMKFKLK